MTRRALVIWCAMVPIAIANGAVRDLLIVPRIGPEAGHVISTIALCLAILALTWLTILWIRPLGAHDAVRIGALWLILTLAFEFLAGHFLFGTPWRRLLADYNVAQGRIWILVPLTTAVAPWLAGRLRDVLGGAPDRPRSSGGHMRPHAGGAS
ncbi:MAG TPA: hypothetical protein VES67_26265 [Vicinamibacterales bacterium]|nr:hypothetical protein [Vicinamibacterales bacterium]